MAKIYGVELRNVRIGSQKNGYGIEAEIYLLDTLIGIFLDDGCGGTGIIKFTCELQDKRNFFYVAWRYFASYPEIDSLALMEYTQKEFVEHKGSLPKVSYKEWPDEKIAMFFVDKLVYLYQLEEQYNLAVTEGYTSIIVVKYFALKNAKFEPVKVFYTDGSEEQFNQVIDNLEEKSRNYVITRYNSSSDFDIE